MKEMHSRMSGQRKTKRYQARETAERDRATLTVMNEIGRGREAAQTDNREVGGEEKTYLRVRNKKADQKYESKEKTRARI
jgi:hypothetical protein